MEEGIDLFCLEEVKVQAHRLSAQLQRVEKEIQDKKASLRGMEEDRAVLQQRLALLRTKAAERLRLQEESNQWVAEAQGQLVKVLGQMSNLVSSGDELLCRLARG